MEDFSTVEKIKAQQDCFFEAYQRNHVELTLPDVPVKEPETESTRPFEKVTISIQD
jgi:hypothetical protein